MNSSETTWCSSHLTWNRQTTAFSRSKTQRLWWVQSASWFHCTGGSTDPPYLCSTWEIINKIVLVSKWYHHWCARTFHMPRHIGHWQTPRARRVWLCGSQKILLKCQKDTELKLMLKRANFRRHLKVSIPSVIIRDLGREFQEVQQHRILCFCSS